MKLLLAIDIHAKRTLTFEDAATWATRLGATLDLVYINAFGSNLEVKEEADRNNAAAEASLRELISKLPEANRGRVHLLTGDPAEMVCQLAPSFDAVLVATHGRTGLAHLWMGSVAEQIVRRAPVPVIVLRLGLPIE